MQSKGTKIGKTQEKEITLQGQGGALPLWLEPSPP